MMQTGEFEFFYDQKTKECFWKDEDTQIYYPCIKFVKERISLINQFGFGVSVWDAGQGPHYFYHLF